MASSLPSATRFHRLCRAGAAVALSVALTVTAGCGFDVQTNQPYTPGEGINADVGGRGVETVSVRNLLIASKEPGTGFVSASLTSAHNDTLQRITGRAYQVDGTAGSPLTTSLPGPVELTAGSLLVLTDEQLITITGADLAPGLEAELTLTFATAGETTLRVPIVPADDAQFDSVTHSPAPAGEE